MTGDNGRLYISTKTYNHSVGLSCCFRQWRAESHCRFLHGYALKVHIKFGSHGLDERNWVVDFGSLKTFKKDLETFLDHKTLVASDDPELETFRKLHEKGLIQLVLVPSTGCESVAHMIYSMAEDWLASNRISTQDRSVWVEEVEVAEHEGNSAIVRRLK